MKRNMLTQSQQNDLDRLISITILSGLVIAAWMLMAWYADNNWSIFGFLFNIRMISWAGKKHDEMVRTGEVAF